jgi:cation diffusion facilitator CzcD-associated flavoprotein CzcO
MKMKLKRGLDMSVVRYEKEVNLFGEYDVAVFGGGPAGVCAAIEAARCGKKVLLAEACGMLGGMATSALVGPFMTCYDRDGDNQIVKGLFDEIVERTVEAGGAVRPSETDSPSRWTSYLKKYHRHVAPFNSFTLQLVLDRMVKEAGVHTLLYTKYVETFCPSFTRSLEACPYKVVIPLEWLMITQFP